MIKPFYGKWKIYKYGKCEPEWGVCHMEDSCAEFLINKTLIIQNKFLELLEEDPCLNLKNLEYGDRKKKCSYKISDLEIKDTTCGEIFKYQRWQDCSDMDSKNEDEILTFYFHSHDCLDSIIYHFDSRKKYNDIIIWIQGRAFFLKKVKKKIFLKSDSSS